MDSAVSNQSRAFGTISRQPSAFSHLSNLPLSNQQLTINNQQSTISNSSLTPPHSDAANSPSPGDWNKIEFSPSSTNSRMSWCKIEYANFGVYPVKYKYFNFFNVLFVSLKGSPILIWGSEMII
ncbi:hypothetical protein ISS37_00035 [candidate division KSB1 bacterium]|nr:hypothetical protein [candidate division KSB1 bacterium]